MKKLSRRELLAGLAFAAPSVLAASRSLAQAYRPSSEPITAPAVDEVAGSRVMLYGDRLETEYVAGGWMPDGKGLRQDVACRDNPHGGRCCIRAGYRLADNGWVGIGWLWLNKFEGHSRRPPDLYRLLQAQRGDHIVLRLWARSKDRAWVKLQCGGGSGDSIAFPVNTDPDWLQLTPEWKRYELDLTKQDLSGVIQIFGTFLDREHNSDLDKPVVEWDLDDVYLVKLQS